MELTNRLKMAWKGLQGFNPGSTGTGFAGAGGLELGKNRDAIGYVKAYESWVYACVRKIAETMSGVDYGLYAKKENEAVRIEDHPFLELLKQVNPVMNFDDVMNFTSIYLNLTGNAYWYVPRNGLGLPAELWVLESQNVKIVPGKEEVVKGYIYQKGASRLALSVEEVVHFSYPNPLDPYYLGMSPVQAAHYSVDSNDYIQKYGMATWKNMGSVSLFVKLIEEAKSWSKEQKDEFKQGWMRTHRGTDNAGKMVIAPAVEDIKNFALSPREMDYSKSRADIRDEILAIFGVPKSKFTQDTGPRARVESDDYAFHKETIQPQAKRIDKKITSDLLFLYDSKLEFRHDKSTSADKDYELKKEESRLKSYVLSVNEVREKDGLKPASWGKLPLMPFSIVPYGGSVPTADTKSKATEYTMSPELRERLWVAFIRAHGGVEREWVAGLNAMYGEQEKEVLKRLKEYFGKGYRKGIADHILLSVVLEEEQIWKASEKYIKDGAERGVALAEGKIGATGLPMDIWEYPVFNQYLMEKELKIKTIPSTLHEELREQIMLGVNGGEGYDEIAGRVKSTYTNQTDFGARRIARTEITETINRSQLIAAESSGVVEVKVWLSAMDSRVRTSHAAANMQEVELNGRFVIAGYGCRYPGDPSLPAEEVCNCRCDMTFTKRMEE